MDSVSYLRQFETCDDLGNGDFSRIYTIADEYECLLAQVKALEVYPGRCARLEIENAALRYRLKKLEGSDGSV